ncbi:PP2C family protein-serine/threonine phosphatase [Mycetocola spongiae]|uniref:PP2C family protein-serine/threonine phosphatase n=1 Tax=Mycetocola spongiae TaxID=2859226 RepID=UPI001CF4C4F7|nr:protein phosphatase 2C domain-containing protein [Mycetocola spongiae]UCR90195.1 protein phosphatase 2C domain-containing protein [Mycetocola spongiae]
MSAAPAPGLGGIWTAPSRECSVMLGWAGGTDTGLTRERNEDSFFARAPLFVVADGMGGHAAGDLASAAVTGSLAALRETPMGPEQIQGGLARATELIAEHTGVIGGGGGSTVVGVTVTERAGAPYWMFFNLGDSRAYLLSGEEFSRVSVDHSVVQALVDGGALTTDQAATDRRRNVITRAVGFEADPVPDYWLIPILAGSTVLCCSDGLTAEVSEEKIHAILSAAPTPRIAVDSLIAEALAAGGRDNVTAVVVRAGEIRGAARRTPGESGGGRHARPLTHSPLDNHNRLPGKDGS